MKKRRNADEICSDLKKSRQSLYSLRNRLVRKEKKGGLKKKETVQVNNKIRSTSLKIDKLSAKIFKCGKRYALLKKSRRSLLTKVNRIKNRLKKERDMPKREKNELYTTLAELNDKISALDVLMGKEIVEKKKGSFDFVGDLPTEVFVDIVTVWEARAEVEDRISGSGVHFVNIKGVKYDLDGNVLTVLYALDDYIADIMASQRLSKTQTPMITLITNLKIKELTIE